MRNLLNLGSVNGTILLCGIAAIGLAQNPQAQPPSTPTQAAAAMVIGPAKIAFVNMQQVITTCDEGKDESAKYQQWAEKKQAELQALQTDVDKLKTQLEVQGPKLTDEARAELSDAIDAKDTQLQRTQQDTQKEADRRRQRLTDAIYRKSLTVISKLAKEKNLDSVQFFDVNRDAYVNSSLLITDELVKAYNAAYPVTSSLAPVKK